LVIEFQTPTDGTASLTTPKNKKSSSSTTVIEVGEEMRMKIAQAVISNDTVLIVLQTHSHFSSKSVATEP